jgi:hypothetical protein
LMPLPYAIFIAITCQLFILLIITLPLIIDAFDID